MQQLMVEYKNEYDLSGFLIDHEERPYEVRIAPQQILLFGLLILYIFEINGGTNSISENIRTNDALRNEQRETQLQLQVEFKHSVFNAVLMSFYYLIS